MTNSLAPKRCVKRAAAPVLERTTPLVSGWARPTNLLAAERRTRDSNSVFAQRLDRNACVLSKSCDFCHLNTNFLVVRMTSLMLTNSSQNVVPDRLLWLQLGTCQQHKSSGRLSLASLFPRLRPQPGCMRAELPGARPSADSRLHLHGR